LGDEMYRLICIDGIGVGEEITLRNKVTTVGRNEDNVICILDSEVSRQHCNIVVTENTIQVEDLGSRNGVYINEVHRTGANQMSANDLLRIGNTTYLLYDDSNPPANYEEIKNILSTVPKPPQEVMMNILELQMSQTVVLPKDSVPDKGSDL